MIKFNLKCSGGHGFESWFGSNSDYEKLRAKGLISCMVCGSSEVEKAIMAPQVRAEPAAKPLREKPKIDDVGRDFPDEARRIHAGEAPKRAIIGQAKVEEAQALIDEGVPVLPVDWKPKQVN